MRSFLYFNNTHSDMIKALILGVVSSVTMIGILMCVLCAVFLASPLPPQEYLEYIILTIDAISVFIGGYIAARINKCNGMIVGLIVGFIVFLSLIISGFIAFNTTLTLVTLLKAIVILIFSILGGIKGVNVKEKIKIK